MKKNKKGAVTIIFLTVLALIITLLLAATQSRLSLALRRSQSAGDTIVSSYKAESEANDVMSKLVGKYLGSANLDYTENVDGMRIDVKGKDEGSTQTVDVTVNRDFAVSSVQATREIKSVEQVDSVEMILALDCTGSMDDPSGAPGQTRFDAQKEAALSFIDTLSGLSNADKFKLGVTTFGINAKWLRVGGRDVSPENGLDFADIKSAVENGFGSTRSTSPACSEIMDATSVGTAFTFSHDYFSTHKQDGVKQIEIVITDGEPNSRIPSIGCSPNAFCPAFPLSPDGTQNYCEDNEYGWQCYQYSSYKDGPYEADNFNQAAYDTCQPLAYDFLQCAVADTDSGGIRDPNIDAYAVTIFDNPPRDVVTILRNYTSENGYYNASRASQLKNILNVILNEILKEHSTVTIKRIIPS